MHYQYITIEGNIGAGKTTLSHLLAKEYGAQLVLEEFANNPFLSKFYEAPEHYAFQLEMSFLAARFKQLKGLIGNTDLFNTITITDYLFIKCKLFAQINLAADEYQLFETLFDIIYPNLPMPQLLIYLHCPVNKLQQNIKKRARSYEQSIADEYLLKIQEAYWQAIKTMNIPVVVLDTSTLDFVSQPQHYSHVMEVINTQWPAGVHVIDTPILV
jgi:deoxyguanosine kinase